MRLTVLIAAVFMALAAPAIAQELKVGNSYSGTVKLSEPDNGLYLTLPEGQWILASLEHARNNPINTGDFVPIVNGRFVRTDAKKRIVGIVTFESGNGSNGGWTVPAFCNRKDAYYLKTEIQNRGPRNKSCWGVYPAGIGHPAPTSSQYIRDFHQYAATEKLIKPPTMITVQFYRSSLAKYLHAYYMFNPETEGAPRGAVSSWQKDVVIADAKRVQYLDSKKAWGEKWKPTFDAAFAGGVK